MRVNRDFRNTDIVRVLESIDEVELEALLHGEVLDIELADAIRHGAEVDGYEGLVSAKDYLAGRA